jgi:heterodisulfide reductase subunit B
MKLGYYPGCSLLATAREFDESLRAVAGVLGIELVELDDWSCCGATSAHATNHLLGIALPARNLALAEEQGHAQLLAPCAACYSRLATARHEIGTNQQLGRKIGEVLARPTPFRNSVGVRNVVEILRDVIPVIKEKAATPLGGLKVACYYGCLLLRPAEVTGFDDPENPRSMEDVAQATGAQPVDWQLRTECCGGSFSLSRTGSVVRLGRAVINDAQQAGAEALVVACPMCHSNLDFRQQAMGQREHFNALPILYIPQLVGLALGLKPEALGLHRHFVSTKPVLERLAAAAAPAGSEVK